jgi:hypothetical protein
MGEKGMKMYYSNYYSSLFLENGPKYTDGSTEGMDVTSFGTSYSLHAPVSVFPTFLFNQVI